MRRHHVALAALLAVVVSLFPATVASARASGDEPAPQPRSEPDTRIVGGTPASIGDFPFQAAIFYQGSFRCGGTVVAKSWVLTAGHCLYASGRRIADSSIDVVTGTSVLSNGGQDLRVRSSYVIPSYAADPDLGDDVALLRLREPTRSTSVSIIGTSAAERALDDAGVNATIVGWGSTFQGGGAVNQFRRATVPITTDAACRSAYPGSNPRGYVFLATTMVCAGRPAGGIDSCQGDSGGPLLAAVPGGWRQIGVTSWGDGCAQAGSPGVYSRLTHSRSWISYTTRFGPFAPDGRAFIDRQMRDFYGRPATSSELTNWTNLLKTRPPSSLIELRATGSVWRNATDPIARLHKVAMGTYPTTTVYNNWVPHRRKGMAVSTIAPWFAAGRSNLTDGAYVDTIYQNAMGQGPSAQTKATWVSRLQNRSWSRGAMLAYFAESSTARARLSEGVRVSTTWFGMMRIAPDDARIVAHAPLDETVLIDLLLQSYSYSYRFR